MRWAGRCSSFAGLGPVARAVTTSTRTDAEGTEEGRGEGEQGGRAGPRRTGEGRARQGSQGASHVGLPGAMRCRCRPPAGPPHSCPMRTPRLRQQPSPAQAYCRQEHVRCMPQVLCALHAAACCSTPPPSPLPQPFAGSSARHSVVHSQSYTQPVTQPASQPASRPATHPGQCRPLCVPCLPPRWCT